MIVFAVLASVSQMAAPALVSSMIDGVSDNDKQTIIVLAIAMIVISLLGCLMNVISTNLAAGLTTRFAAELRKVIFNKVQSFSAAEVDKFGTSSLITRNTTDVTVIQSFLAMLFRLGILAPIMVVVGLILSIAFTGKLALVLAVAIPLLVVVIALILIRASRHSVKLRSRIDGINKLFLETLEGVRVIRAFNRQEHEIERFNEMNEDTAEVSRKSAAISGMLTPVVNALFGLTSVGAMVVGLIMTMNGTIDAGALVAATQYINMILIAIMLLATVVSMFPDAYACMKRIVLVRPAAEPLSSGMLHLPIREQMHRLSKA